MSLFPVKKKNVGIFVELEFYHAIRRLSGRRRSRALTIDDTIDRSEMRRKQK